MFATNRSGKRMKPRKYFVGPLRSVCMQITMDADASGRLLPSHLGFAFVDIQVEPVTSITDLVMLWNSIIEYLTFILECSKTHISPVVVLISRCNYK